jgi:cobalt-zinc-cadmium resistance protein CzcA
MKMTKLLISASGWIPFIILTFNISVSAQKLTLDQAVQSALQNNLSIKAAEYRIDYFKESKKTGSDIGKLSALWMHGQYNSLYTDNNLTLLQTIPFPTTIASQLKLGQEQVIGAERSLSVQQNNLAFEVKSAYYQLLYQEALRKLLQRQDSLYADFARASGARYKAGESNLLEKTTAETQRMDAQNILMLNGADIQITKAKLQALLKSEQVVEAAEELKKRALPTELDTILLRNNPDLKFLSQEVKISQQLKRTERSRIAPDLMVGGFAQSLTGVQNINGQDVFFPSSKTFTGFQLGLSIPLWIKPNLARAKAASFQEEATRKNAENFEVMLNGSYAQALREVEKNIASLNYYESSALQNADLILSQARKAFHGGEIGYIEYLQALKSAIGIQSNYRLAINQYNQSVVKLEFLLGKY